MGRIQKEGTQSMADEMKVNIRQATLKDALGIARVHLSSWQTTYQGIVPDRILRKKRGQKALLEGKSREATVFYDSVEGRNTIKGSIVRGSGNAYISPRIDRHARRPLEAK